MRYQVAGWLLFIGLGAYSAAQTQQETLLFDLNAYDPVPSPDGRLIAYVLTGRKLEGGSGGFGRSNLQSDVKFCDPGGQTLQNPYAEGFLGEWLPDSSGIVSFRDWKFSLLDPGGSKESQSMLPGLKMEEWMNLPERVAYLSTLHKFVWIGNTASGAVLESAAGPVAEIGDVQLSSLIVPSPDQRFLAIASLGYRGLDGGLHVYDTVKRTLVNLGDLMIHPDSDWDWSKPSWNPWFPDGKHLAFFSGSVLVVASPDGKQRHELLKADNGGLAIPSPDGSLIAYATFSPRPRKYREDLKFWQGSILWVVPSKGGIPAQITKPSRDETYDLRWLTQDSLIFDRITEGMFNEHTRIWTIQVGN